MKNKTLDLRKVFGMVVTYDQNQALDSPEDPFEVLAELHPGGQSAIHLHPAQDETYIVKEGEMEIFMNGKWRLLSVGDDIVIPRGTVHGFRNTNYQKAVVINRHDPGLRFGEMLETIEYAIKSRKMKGVKAPKDLFYMAAIMVRYNDVIRPIKPPYGLLKVIARIGGFLGYRV